MEFFFKIGRILISSTKPNVERLTVVDTMAQTSRNNGTTQRPETKEKYRRK